MGRPYEFFCSLLLALFLRSFAKTDLIALSSLEVINAGGDTVIRLKAFESKGDQLTYKITSLPSSGSLYQLSQVYSTKGYEPKAGTLINAIGTIVTGSNNRIYYKRPSPDAAGINKWSSFNFTVNNGRETSLEATITLVPPSGSLNGSDFLLNNGGWQVVGNKALASTADWEPYSRGSLLNRYIYGTDDKINIRKAGAATPDQSLWYFSAAPSLLGNTGASYGGTLSFTLGGFSGDFSTNNGLQTHIVELECAKCVGPVGPGILLAIPLSAMQAFKSFTGAPTVFTVSLLESAGWIKDPQNSLLPWTAPSQCDMIQVLSRLSAMRILGDWTPWYETVALDNVLVKNTKEHKPLCGMLRPDASICTC